MTLKKLAALILAAAAIGGCSASRQGQQTDGATPLLLMVDSSLSGTCAEQAEAFAQDAVLYSGGTLNVDVRTGVSNQDILRGQGCDISLLYNSQLSVMASELSMLSMPFLYDSGMHMSGALNSPELMTRWRELLEPYGIYPLYAIYNGSEMLATNRGALRAASDFSGAVIAMHTGNPDRENTFRALGASVVTHDDESLAGRLGVMTQILPDESGVTHEAPIDTVEVSAAQALLITEPAQTISVVNTGHTISPLWLAVNKDCWDALDEKQQAALMEAGAGLAARLETASRELDSNALGELMRVGATVTDVERKRIAASVYGADGSGGPHSFPFPEYYDKRLYQMIQDMN